MSYKDNHADRIVLTSFPPTGIEPTLVQKKKKKINEDDSVAISLGIWRVNIQSMWNRWDIGVQTLEDSVRSVPCGEVTSYWQQSRSSVLQTEKDNRVRAQIRPWLQELEQNYTAE